MAKKRRKLIKQTATRRSADFLAGILRNRGEKVVVRHKKGEQYWNVMQ